MPFGSNEPSFQWTHQSILSYAPTASGVYAISNAQKWIYIGESGDIQARLLEHLNGDNACITRNAPTGFQFEVLSPSQRLARQDQLIVALVPVPVCNQRFS